MFCDKFSIRDCPGEIIVGVVGLGHLKGINAHWNQDIDRAALLQIPVKSESKFLRKTLLLSFGIVAVSCVAYFVNSYFF